MKALDAYEKATAGLNAAVAEIESRKVLDDLKNQWIAVKDMIIQEQGKLIELYQKQRKGNSVWGRIKSILEVAEKIALIAAGILVGRGL